MAGSSDWSAGWERLFWTVLEHTRNPVGLFDYQRVNVAANTAWAEFLGTSPEQLVGGRLGRFVAPEEREAIEIVVLRDAVPRSGSEVPSQLGELTSREREIVMLVALGDTNVEISEKLGISPATIKTHIRKAMAKTGARTRAHLVAIVLADRRLWPHWDTPPAR